MSASVPHFDWIQHHSRATPNQLALFYVGSNRGATYSELDARVSCLAGYLRTVAAVGRGDRVAVLAQNCAELFELMFACARIGAVYVPLNYRLTGPELSFIVSNAAVSILVAEREFQQVAHSLKENGTVPAVLLFSSAESWNETAVMNVAEPVRDGESLTHDDVQMLMYTSGTTGRPKGAVITYGMTFWNAVNVGIPAGISRRTRLLSVMPMFHTGGLNLFANPVIHAGGCVYIMKAFEPARMLDALSDPSLGITHTFAVPTAYQMMSAHPDFEQADLTRLQMGCVGGAATPRQVLESWLRKGVVLANGYGMTETSPAVTLLSGEDATRKIGSVGIPLLHTEIRIVKPDGSDAGVNEPGELLVRGPNVTPGYWRDDVATAEAILDGWLRTGDVMRRDAEGFCYVVDRAKDMYISGGENVYPAEIESVITTLPDVAEAAVIGVSDERWGETGVACVVLRPGARVEAQTLIEHCAARLARYKLPKRVLFVEQLPRTITGKVHKPTLRKQVSENKS